MTSRSIRGVHLVIAGLALAVIVTAYIGYGVSESIRNSYAVWWVADMVVEHMIANEDEWPTNWSDLEDDYRMCVARSGQPWTFDELRHRVVVDWTAKPEDIVTDKERRVIWLADGTDSHWEHREPNKIVADYLESREGKSHDISPAK